MTKTKKSSQLKLIEQPVYHYWQAFYRSFYSSYLYIDVGKRWRGLGFLYLAILIALLCLPYSIKTMITFSHKFDQELLEPFSQIPRLYVQDGKVSSDKPMPYLIKNAKNQVVIVVDTSGKITEFSQEYPDLSMLITKDKFMIKPPKPSILVQNKAQSKPLIETIPPHSNGIFDGKTYLASHKIVPLKWFTVFMLYPIIFSIFYAASLVMFPVLALFFQFFSVLFFSFRTSFISTCRLLIVAGTPALLLSFIFMYFHIAFYGSGIIMTVLLFAYFSFAIRSLKKDSQRLTSTR